MKRLPGFPGTMTHPLPGKASAFPLTSSSWRQTAPHHPCHLSSTFLQMCAVFEMKPAEVSLACEADSWPSTPSQRPVPGSLARWDLSPRPWTAALGAAQGAQPGRSRTAGSVRAGSAKEVCKLLVTLMLRSRADFPAFGESSCIQFMYGVTLIGHEMHFSHDENMHLSAVCCVQVGMLCLWLHGRLYGNKGCSALRACRSKQKRGSTARSGMCQELHLLLGVRDRHVSVSISL